MATVKYISHEKLPQWLAALAAERRLLVPVASGDGSVVFRPFDPARRPVLDGDATAPPKAAIFPACQELFRYEQTKDPENPEHTTMQLLPDPKAVPTVVFGARPCGVRGFLIFDRVYLGQKFPDPYYAAAREATVFVTMACKTVENTCFCHWVGGGPSDPAGSDVLCTPVDGGYLVEAVSDKGAPLLANPLLEDGEAKVAEADAVKGRRPRGPGRRPGHRECPGGPAGRLRRCGLLARHVGKMHQLRGLHLPVPDLLLFHHHRRTIRTFRPTPSLLGCLHALPVHHGGVGTQSPADQGPPPENRVGHKFSYYPSLHEGLVACCGCGRCIKSCPVSVDIREIVQQAVARAKA